jgi:hypothetical protein
MSNIRYRTERTVKSAFLRVIEILKKEGLKSLWFKVLSETFYRRVVLIERILDEPIHPITSRIAVTINLLEQSNVDEYCEFHPDTTKSDIQNRLDSGHWCFIACYQGCIVHTCWAASRVLWFDYLNREIQLTPDEVFVYNSYTDPSFRGLNISGVRILEMVRYFQKAGYRRMMGAVVPENKLAFRPGQKSGYRPIGTLGFVRIGPIKRDFFWEKPLFTFRLRTGSK